MSEEQKAQPASEEDPDIGGGMLLSQFNKEVNDLFDHFMTREITPHHAIMIMSRIIATVISDQQDPERALAETSKLIGSCVSMELADRMKRAIEEKSKK